MRFLLDFVSCVVLHVGIRFFNSRALTGVAVVYGLLFIYQGGQRRRRW